MDKIGWLKRERERRLITQNLVLDASTERSSIFAKDWIPLWQYSVPVPRLDVRSAWKFIIITIPSRKICAPDIPLPEVNHWIIVITAFLPTILKGFIPIYAP